MANSLVRAAVYTRKSVDKGDDGEFGSIEAQRESCESLIASKRGAGWVVVPTRYDDLGASGATLQREGFERLMTDVRAGAVDAIVVYKFDRLSRSLVDFTSTAEEFARRGVAFVSVTQAIDTSTSTGKLLVNLLATFGEFERETTAERVRDKVRAARRHGYWTGGRPPLGYDLVDRQLVPNEREAANVREIFDVYLRRQSLREAVEELAARGFLTKSWVNRRGGRSGGRPFTKNGLRNLLKSPWCVGLVAADGELVEGRQDAIIERSVWDEAQRVLTRGSVARSGRRTKTNALLQGLLKCGACGAAMGPHTTRNHGRLYLSYVCQTIQKKGARACPGSRVPAHEIEGFVIDQLRVLGSDAGLLAEAAASSAEAHRMEIAEAKALGRRARADADRLRHELEVTRALDIHDEDAEAELGLLIEQRESAAREAAQHALSLEQTGGGDEQALQRALEAFLPVWEGLFPGERRRMLELLFESIVYDAPAGELTLRFSASGAALLASEATSAA